VAVNDTTEQGDVASYLERVKVRHQTADGRSWS